jgi:hypothetical protein
MINPMHPMDEPDVRINRVKLAFAIAIIADLMEFPVIWLETFQWDSVVLFGRAIGVVLDACVMFILSKLLGFHWAFVPGFVLEVIPTLDMFPSWVACVAYVVWEKKRKQQAQLQSSPLRPLIDVQEVKAIGASIVSRLAPPPLAAIPVPKPPLLPPEPAHEKRLQSLADLRDKNLISPTEYEAKRQQILSEI